MKKISIIIPTYNERLNIVRLLSALTRTMKKFNYEIIVVDDNSPDGTSSVVSAYSNKNHRVRLVKRINERNLSSAIISGFEEARGSTFVVMDADLSHDPEILPEMVKNINKGYDIVIGSRRIKGGGAENWPFYRKIQSDIATMLARLFIGVKIKDPMSGFFALKRDLYINSKHRLNSQGYKILLEIYAKSNPKNIKEIPFIFRNRSHGYSKLTRKVVIQYLKMLFDIRFREP